MSEKASTIDPVRLSSARRWLIFFSVWLALGPVAFGIAMMNRDNHAIVIPAVVFFCLTVLPLMVIFPQAIEYRHARKGITVDF